MDIVALVLAAIAALIFLLAGRPVPPGRARAYRFGPWAWDAVTIGLFFLTVALICQFCQVTGHDVG